MLSLFLLPFFRHSFFRHFILGLRDWVGIFIVWVLHCFIIVETTTGSRSTYYELDMFLNITPVLTWRLVETIIGNVWCSRAHFSLTSAQTVPLDEIFLCKFDFVRFECGFRCYYVLQISRVRNAFIFHDNILEWFLSYVPNRSQTYVEWWTHQFSGLSALKFGFPQGFVLGPPLYMLYLHALIKVIESFRLCNPCGCLWHTIKLSHYVQLQRRTKLPCVPRHTG